MFTVTSVTFILGAAAFAACSSSNGPSVNDSGSKDAGAPDSTARDAGSEDADVDGSDDAGNLLPTPPAWDQPVTRPTDTGAASGRSQCKFTRGAMPAATLGSSTPVDTDIPIKNIVVVMMENRSFDSMFGHLNEYGKRSDVQEPPPGASNPAQAAHWDAGNAVNAPDAGDAGAGDAGAGTDDAGATDGGNVATYPWVHAPQECFADTDHSWKGQHWAYDDGLNDGFYAENNGGTDPGDIIYDAGLLGGARALWWYDQTDIPFDYQLANTFALADNYFCSLLGPTAPNRLYLVAATSFGLTDNTLPTGLSQNIPDNVVVPDELEQRHVTWGTYSNGIPSLEIALNIGISTRYPEKIRFTYQDFLKAAAAGTLPQVAWLDPSVGSADGQVTNNDDHPPADVQIGSQFLSQVYQAVTTGPQWKDTALFITWDENGGEYDHVPPTAACAPDSTPPQLNGTDIGIAGDFARYGFRVPLIVVSPYVKKGYVGHTVYDHTSIARFIEAKFKIPALTARDANADALMDLFDFTNAPAFTAAPTIAPPVVDDAGLETCTQLYGQ